MRLKINHFKITIIIAILLSLVTVLATSLSGNWSTRAIYNIFKITFFNFSILLLNAIFFTKDHTYIGAKTRKFIRIAFLTAYSGAYLFATGMFITTGQVARIQTIMFIYEINTTIMSAIIIGGLAIGLLIATTIFYRGTALNLSEKRERNQLKFAFYISLIFFVLTILTNAYYLEIEEPIITDKIALAEYKPEALNLQEKVLDINFTKENPNVIFILLESMSASRWQLYGYDREVMPNTEELAKKSIIFKKTYTAATHSDYAQTGLLSSRYMLTSKYRTVSASENPRKFIWDIFKENNYTTGYHSAQDDLWQNMYTYINYTNLDNWTNSRSDEVTDYGSGRQLKDFDHIVRERAINWLNSTLEKNESFFLYLNFQSTHIPGPKTYPEEYAYYLPDIEEGPFGTQGEDTVNIYDNTMRYIDDQIGQILNFLEKNNKTNDTVIIITADHGHDLEKLHGIGGHGNTIYNEELLVPAIFFLPGVEPQTIEEPVSHIDFVPTIIDLLGYEIPNEFQGEVMKKGRPIISVAQTHKYFIGMILNGTKIIIDKNRELIEIYELGEDPEELNNIEYSEKYKDQALRLLLWDYCQRDYYQNERWKGSLNLQCDKTNNFKL